MGIRQGQTKLLTDFRLGQTWSTNNCGRTSEVKITGINFFEERIKYKYVKSGTECEAPVHHHAVRNWSLRLQAPLTPFAEPAIFMAVYEDNGDTDYEGIIYGEYDDVIAEVTEDINNGDCVKATIYKAYESLEKEGPKLKVTRL